nr:MAG TPA: hypothetical protein [Caudoviricetes sp.]
MSRTDQQTQGPRAHHRTRGPTHRRRFDRTTHPSRPALPAQGTRAHPR